jgi:hypothetical protein
MMLEGLERGLPKLAIVSLHVVHLEFMLTS